MLYLNMYLMLELVVLTEDFGAVGAVENASAVFGDLPLAFHACGLAHGTGAGVCLQAG